MKLKWISVPLALVAGSAGYVVFHPGVAYASPRMNALVPTRMPAGRATYSIDPMHTSMYFEIRHLGLSVIHGRITNMTGKVVEDSDHPLESSVELTAQMNSIDTAVPPRDEHLRSKDFFEVETYPTLTFKSTKLEKTKDGYEVTGDLTMKGKTKSIVIPFRHFGPYAIPGMADQPARIGVIADPIVIKRSDFGISSQDKFPDGTEAISNDVTVRISLEGTLDK